MKKIIFWKKSVTTVTETIVTETVTVVENEDSQEFSKLSPEKILEICKKNPQEEVLEKGFYTIYDKIDDGKERFLSLKKILWLLDTKSSKYAELQKKSTQKIY